MSFDSREENAIQGLDHLFYTLDRVSTQLISQPSSVDSDVVWSDVQHEDIFYINLHGSLVMCAVYLTKNIINDQYTG